MLFLPCEWPPRRSCRSLSSRRVVSCHVLSSRRVASCRSLFSLRAVSLANSKRSCRSIMAINICVIASIGEGGVTWGKSGRISGVPEVLSAGGFEVSVPLLVKTMHDDQDVSRCLRPSVSKGYLPSPLAHHDCNLAYTVSAFSYAQGARHYRSGRTAFSLS